MSGFSVDPGALRAMASTLSQAEDELACAASRTGTVPDAGSSTGETGATLEVIRSEAEEIIDRLAELTDAVVAGAADYESGDRSASAVFDAAAGTGRYQ